MTKSYHVYLTHEQIHRGFVENHMVEEIISCLYDSAYTQQFRPDDLMVYESTSDQDAINYLNTYFPAVRLYRVSENGNYNAVGAYVQEFNGDDAEYPENWGPILSKSVLKTSV